ncbi:hypothetical protein VFPPC_18690 [Pochonia chlamydosporia 170]|uniref:Uncharacterized protein n=1 Tax=Pochonia chlamydosporia 170 TaxID=1380566 RepID=A0A219AS15_METCM|nr:hypothetical protein VFPPC_18690 [Pochonia chlamydosporia 170]OWT43583.1 hypothetical protein VFPPC_18690 [Pochonia chlamydosporia 170]
MDSFALDTSDCSQETGLWNCGSYPPAMAQLEAFVVGHDAPDGILYSATGVSSTSFDLTLNHVKTPAEHVGNSYQMVDYGVENVCSEKRSHRSS